MNPSVINDMPLLMRHNYFNEDITDFFDLYLDIAETTKVPQLRTQIMDILSKVYHEETGMNWDTNYFKSFGISVSRP